MFSKRILQATTVLIVALSLTACLGESDKKTATSGGEVTGSPGTGGTTTTTPVSGTDTTVTKLTMNGVPVGTAIEGSPYAFQPYVEVPAGKAVTFSVTNKPLWAGFDSSNGRLSGKPTSADVGTYSDIKIAATADGESAAIGPFNISVRSATSNAAGATFTFAEVPEISFVRGYAESETLGIWQLDTGNLWSPGDVDNASGWKPRVATELHVVEGALSGVSYDSSTTSLRYDGRGDGGWARVKLVAPEKSAESNEFYVRVLVPKAIWGKDATTRPDIAERFRDAPKFDYGKSAFADAWSSLPKTGTEHDPDFVLVLGGEYSSAVEAKLSGQIDEATGLPKDRINWRTNIGTGDRAWFYLIGEPGSRPKITGYDVRNGGLIQIPGYRVTVLRNFEIETVVTSTSDRGWVVGVPNRKYWSKLYAHTTHGLNRPEWPEFKSINDDVFGSHSPEGDTTDSFVRGGVPKAPNDWKSWFWNNRFLRTGGNSLKHTIYLHGRPDAWLIYNNNLHNGGNGSSAIKATVGHYRVLNSRISAFANDSDPGNPNESMNQQLIDVPSASDVVIYNNEIIGGRRMIGSDVSGTRTGLIWFNPRRTLWGTDDPRYPDVTYQAAPFVPFSFQFNASGVSSVNYPHARVELRKRDGEWGPLTSAPLPSSGRNDNWTVTVQPSELPANGTYEMRINGGDRASSTYILLTVYRNANYLAVTSFADGDLKTPWYADGPKAYVIDDGAAYWSAMRNWGNPGPGGDGRADPTNPYTQKKYVAYNRFVWRVHPDLDTKREEAIRDNGSYPSTAQFIGSTTSRFGAVPRTWTDPGVTFLLNNTYDGWRVEDMGTEAWMRTDIEAVTKNPGNVLYGPGQDDPEKRNWPQYFEKMQPDLQPLIVPVGGERTPVAPDATNSPVPPWFNIF